MLNDSPTVAILFKKSKPVKLVVVTYTEASRPPNAYDNVYGTVIVTQPLREFTRFI